MRAALFAFLLTATPAFAAGIPAKPGQNYLAARQQILASGYKPGPTKDYARGCSYGFDDICQNYAETYSCSGTGYAGCMFIFWKDDQPYLVQTQGEELGQQKISKVKTLTVADQKRMFAAQ